MNYYSFHIGDYRRDTAHLSLLEHGVYRQLLDWIYLDEKPIPKETDVVFRRLCARTVEEKGAVIIVLEELFELTENGYIQTRCMGEIATYQGRAARARENGKLGGRPSITTVVIDGLSEKTKTKANHEPLTTTQEPLNSKLSSKDMSTPLATTAKKGTRLPEDWQLPKTWGDWALSEKPNWTSDDIRRVAADFKDHWLAKAGKDAVKMDWAATWRKWVRSPLNEVKPQSKGYSGGVQEARLDIARQIFGDRNGTDRQIIDINTIESDSSDRKGIQENVPFLRGSGIC